MRSVDSYVLLLGSNIDPAQNLPQLAQHLGQHYDLVRISSAYESDAVGAPTAPRFWNQALQIRTDTDVQQLKLDLRAIEHSFGRRRSNDRNAPRTADIDLVLALDIEGRVLPQPKPDPELLIHAHIWIPLLEILPEIVLLADQTSEGSAVTLAQATASCPPPAASFNRVPAEPTPRPNSS